MSGDLYGKDIDEIKSLFKENERVFLEDFV